VHAGQAVVRVRGEGGRWTRLAEKVVTAVVVATPPIAVVAVMALSWGRAVHLRDLAIALVLYVVIGHGITVGYHRLFAHRSFKANRPLKIALAVAGSLAIEGSPIAWVANHRRHHMFSDRDGDPHSPQLAGGGVLGGLRGLCHAHLGWLFREDPTSAARFAPDLLADRDLVVLSKLVPVFTVASLAIPLAAGWALSGWKVEAGLTALLWAGIVRIGLVHHATWSINSICHTFGRRPHETNDHSGNVAVLAIVSLGESWHNFHHAAPASARHGAGPHQIDSSARIIRMFELAGWATHVRWPSGDRLAATLA
jgi:stearoyl-CoA desaturase (delta-9 desaturase)